MNDQPNRRPRKPSGNPVKSGRQGGPGKSGKPGKPYRRPQKDPVRFLAFEALRAVDERDAYANLVLPPLLRKAREKEGPEKFDARDAALATELVYGTLRRQGTYDAIVAACIDRPLREVDPPVLDVLNLGVHQLLGTRIPTHAAVSASVELARVVLGDGRAKFVNAVLRKVAQDDLDGWVAKVAPPYDEDPEDHLAVVHSHPRWVVSALWDALGGGRAGIEDLLEADNERPEVTLVARPGRLHRRRAARREGEESALPGRWSPYAVRLTEGGEPGLVEAVREGRAGVQDEGSQLVALALANAPLDGPDTKWLDGCAGPGGKAAMLAGLAAQRGAALLAAEKPAAPGGPRRERPRRQPRPLPGRRRRRHPPAVAPRHLRPRPDGRGPARARRAAPPPGGPLAPPPAGLGGLRPAPTLPAAHGVGVRAGRRHRRVRHLLAAPGGDPRPRRRRPQAHRAANCSTRGRCCPASRRWGTAPTYSCGRICTGRTRCIWR